MIFRFNKITLDLVEDVSNRVAEVLEVESSRLCFVSGENNDYGGFSLCFETGEDDTYAVLDFDDCDSDLRQILEEFIDNDDVVWSKCGIIHSKPVVKMSLGKIL